MKTWAKDMPLFRGTTLDYELDFERLRTLGARVHETLRQAAARNVWLTFGEIRQIIHKGSEAAISARIRELRNANFGSHTVNHRRRGPDLSDGVWEYQLVVCPDTCQPYLRTKTRNEEHDRQGV